MIKPTTPKLHVLKLCRVCHLLVGRRLTTGFAQYIRGPRYLQVIQSDWPSGQLSPGEGETSANQKPAEAELTNQRPGPGTGPGCHWACCGHERVTTNVWKQNSFSQTQLSIFTMRLQTGPWQCCITQKYAVKSAAVFAISAADRVFACSKPASGRGALTHEYCL